MHSNSNISNIIIVYTWDNFRNLHPANTLSEFAIAIKDAWNIFVMNLAAQFESID